MSYFDPHHVDFAEECPRPPLELAVPLTKKLASLAKLGPLDHTALDSLSKFPRTYHPEANVIQEGVQSGYVHILLVGLAFRYKMLPGGQRQILGYLVPGDIFDLGTTLIERNDHSVAVVIESKVARIPIRQFIEMLNVHPMIHRAMRLAELLEVVMLREWLVNSGQLTAHQKVSHFLCEIATRLNKVGQVDEQGSFSFPLNQSMLADTVGLTTVHINRTLQRLRKEGLIQLHRRRLRILDFARLAEIGSFDGQYLRSLDHAPI